MVHDPICGREVDTFRARAVGIFGGVTYYFCSAECKERFADPRKTPLSAVPPGARERRGVAAAAPATAAPATERAAPEASEARAPGLEPTVAPAPEDESPTPSRRVPLALMAVALLALAAAVIGLWLR